MNGQNNGLVEIEQIKSILLESSKIQNSSIESIAVITDELSKQRALIGGISTKINGISDTVVNLGDRMLAIEENEEITETQVEIINQKIKQRIIEILGSDYYEQAKYFRSFIMVLYRDMKKNHGMASTYRRTKKRDYQRLIDNIEAWIPSMGIEKLKAEIDKKAESKNKAKNNGYLF